MKVKWYLNNMDVIKNKHLEANANYWKYDLLLNAQKVMDNLKKSKSLGFLTKHSDQLKNLVFLVENKASITKEDIDMMVSFDIKIEGNTSKFGIFVNDSYFSEHDVLVNMAGRTTRKYMARKKIGRQELIDNFEKTIRSLYTKDFSGVVVEDDGHKLHVFS